MIISENLVFAELDLMDIVRLFEGAKDKQLSLSFMYEKQNKKAKAEVVFEGKTFKFEYDLNEIEGSIVYKRLIKRYCKLALYTVLYNNYKIDLPWGSLTGIRPVKLAYQLTEEGEEYKSYMENEMFCDKKSIEQVTKIIEIQKDIYKKDDDFCDLFAGIPFCPSRCYYCSFISSEISKAQKYIEPYIDALIKEIIYSKKFIKKLRSVYIGGGTPISLSIKDLEKILNAIGDVNTEYSIEAGRPDCITREVLQLFSDYNVTRICINPQTFSDKTLVKIGRRHTSKDIYEKYDMAKKFGFDINMDLIAGLKDETFEDFKLSIDKAVELKPENITVHTLALKKGSVLKEDCISLAEGEVGKMIEYSREELENSGYNPYYMYRQKYMAGNHENTGYALKGKECIYNIDIMEEISQNIACGANAVSKKVFNKINRIERYKNPKDIKTYIEKIELLLNEKDKLFNLN
jgi:oxygen-independent coproporphyrinogen-3 oxidase